MSEYTKGPWLAENNGETYNVIDSDGGRVLMATCLKGRHGMGGRRSSKECMANLRIAAAATELLEALIGLVDTIEDAGGHDENGDVFDIRDACAAIAKAEGK